MTTTEPTLKAKYRTVDVQEVIENLPEIPKDVVVKAAFGALDERLWELLTDDLWIEEFADAAHIMVRDLHSQIEEVRAAERSGLPHSDPDWLRRVVKVKGRCDTLQAHLGRRLGNYRKRTEGRTVAALLKAISLHRREVESQYDSTPADEELWKVLS